MQAGRRVRVDFAGKGGAIFKSKSMCRDPEKVCPFCRTGRRVRVDFAGKGGAIFNSIQFKSLGH